MSVGAILMILPVILLLGGFSGRFGGSGYCFQQGGVGRAHADKTSLSSGQIAA